MMKRGKYLFSIVILLIALSITSVKAAEKDKILVINSKNIWSYSNNLWYKENLTESANKYKVYIDNDYFGEYTLKKGDSIELYDGEKPVKYKGELLAISSNFNIDIKNEKGTEVSDKEVEETNSILNSSYTKDDLLYNRKYVLDIDNNGTNDEIINVSNMDYSDYKKYEKYFNLVYIKLNNQDRQIIINESIEPENYLISPMHRILCFFEIDGHNYIIDEKKFFAQTKEKEYSLYKYQDGKYTEVEIQDKKDGNVSNNSSSSSKESNNKSSEYEIYIFYGVLLIVMLLIYLFVNILKNKSDKIDD